MWCYTGFLLWAHVVILPILLTSASIDPTSCPVIGILAQETYKDGLISRYFENKTSYIASSYVKYVEGGGARVVPIRIMQNSTYYENLMQKINGVLLPGGATWFNQSDGYADAGDHLIRIAMEMNDNGQFMPIWGTCLGMELLLYKMSNGTDARIDCSSKAQPLPLEFKSDFRDSRLFVNATDEIISVLSSQDVTLNSHQFCYTEESLAEHKLSDSWRVLSLNHDWNGIEFVSIVEHVKYPFYGVQFHPEKPLYEFNAKGAIPHTYGAVLSSQYFANFFINQTRLNSNSFDNLTEFELALIYNFKPEFTSKLGSAYEQQYLFEDIDVGGDEDDDDDGLNIGNRDPNDNGACTLSMSISLLLLVVAIQI